jgi:hypothetical protein
VLMRRLHCPFDGPGLQAADGAPVSDGPEADCAAEGMDPGRGEAGDAVGALLGGRGQCWHQLGLEILWPCRHAYGSHEFYPPSSKWHYEWGHKRDYLLLCSTKFELTVQYCNSFEYNFFLVIKWSRKKTFFQNDTGDREQYSWV